MIDFGTYYRAMASRDVRFDGRFVVAVTSTGVYCRPSCPSRTPKPENVRFFLVPAAAEAAGFRACRRCRPEAGPESPDWNVRGDLVGRALRLIAAGVVDECGVAGLARRLAVSERHLHRQLVAEVGAGPQALALNRRTQVARLLIESSALPLADVAFAAGFSSVRQFNQGMRAAFGRVPSELRRGTAPAGSGFDLGRPLTLHLRYRPPLPAGTLLSWLRVRALPGVESVDGAWYRRTLRLPRSSGVVELAAGEPGTGESAGRVTLRLTLGDLRDVAAAVRRCREMFDLDADPAVIAEVLRPDPRLGPLVKARPGLRVPGCADGFELAVRAILGQQVSLATARRSGVRLVAERGARCPAAHDQPASLFPSPQAIVDADLENIGVARRRADTLRALARAVIDGRVTLERHADREETTARLRELPGIGPGTAEYIAMRALGDPDAFPASDPWLRTAAADLGLPADPHGLAEYSLRWRPWRSYAAMHLWAYLFEKDR